MLFDFFYAFAPPLSYSRSLHQLLCSIVVLSHSFRHFLCSELLIDPGKIIDDTVLCNLWRDLRNFASSI